MKSLLSGLCGLLVPVALLAVTPGRGEAQPILVSGVPALNIAQTCAGVDSVGLPGRTSARCHQNEQDARNELTARWEQFPATDRSTCVATTQIGGFPSYVQVLTCLELARDARSLPAE